MSLKKFKHLTLKTVIMYLPILTVTAFFTYITIDLIVRAL